VIGGCMQAIWKGVISFGLVSIPVAIYSAVRKDELKFRMVRKADLSPINYKRVAEADGQEVPYAETARAYEFEKGSFVPLEEDDFKRARAPGVQSLEIMEFVAQKEIDPLFFDKPYYVEPDKKGAHAYALLRDAMAETSVVGIAKVVIRSRQHLAALRPQGQLLVLELLHFSDELVDATVIKAPVEAGGNRKEMELAKSLIGSMVTDWQPDKYRDDYKSALLDVIAEKLKAGKKAGSRRPPSAKPAGNVVDMVEMLERSLKGFETRPKTKRKAQGQKQAA